MATRPGILTEWPWTWLGNFKYVVLAPFVVATVRRAAAKAEWKDVDFSQLGILPFLLSRALHNQLWISLSRFQTGRSKRRILDRSIDFDQVDRERNWDDQILLNGILFYLGSLYLPGAQNLPFWGSWGVVLTFLLHVGPVEFLYYWLHRALHHHFLYSRYHSHHHSSIVTEPITSVIHPFAEHLVYFALFSIPIVAMIYTGTVSQVALTLYITYIDFMNNMGHCNFEHVPRWLMNGFPLLKYIMYTPSFHSLHHTQFRTNYSLFMPFYDYIYGTMDKSTDSLYETSIKGREETPQVVHITHPTSLLSIYHLRLGFASLASRPYSFKWYTMMIWPLSWLSMLLTWTVKSAFTVERNTFKKIKMHTWAIPRYSFQYSMQSEKDEINSLIEKSILEAEEKGVGVVTLGLLNQGEDLNESGEIFLRRNPKLKVKIVDGSSLAVAVLLHSIPHGTKHVLLRGKPSKIASALAVALCEKSIQVLMVNKEEYHAVKTSISVHLECNLVLSSSYNHKVWIVGDGFTDEEQKRAPKGTHIIPFSQFPPRKLHRDCFYYSTPAMKVPRDLENMHSCENWLPRGIMSAWRIAGILHASEGWDGHECGKAMFGVYKVWDAALRNGFLPLTQV